MHLKENFFKFFFSAKVLWQSCFINDEDPVNNFSAYLFNGDEEKLLTGEKYLLIITTTNTIW